MAPRIPTVSKTKKGKKEHKKRVRFRNNTVGKPRQEFIKPPKNYENVILYYLTKLKRLFGSNDQSKTVVGVTNDKGKISNLCPTSKSKCSGNIVTKDLEAALKDKAFTIVNSALEYGFANNVLERRGNYFILKHKKNSRLFNREATPFPSIPSKRISACKCHICNSHLKSNIDNGKFTHIQKTSRGNIRAESLDNPKFNSKPQNIQKPSQEKVSFTSLTSSNRKSRSCTKFKSGKDCKCRNCRVSKVKPKVARK